MSNWNPARLGVLVVDDDQSVRAMLKSMLKDIQFNQIFEAENGREALQLLNTSPVDVVICDWSMPEITGIDLLRQVRSTGSQIPFVMLTGKADRDSVFEAKSAGVSAYIVKPLTQVQLEAKLRVALSANRAQH